MTLLQCKEARGPCSGIPQVCRAPNDDHLGIRPSIKKVAKRGGQKPRRENGHANIEGQGDYKVIDAFAPLEKFHTGKRRRDRLVPINSRSFVLSAIMDGNGVPSDRALF
jgi:hypothetical protein